MHITVAYFRACKATKTSKFKTTLVINTKNDPADWQYNDQQKMSHK